MTSAIELHKFQEKAFYSKKKITIMSAGIQSGKTFTGALCQGDRIWNSPKDGNHIIVAPTYKMLQQATLPKFLSLYEKYGKYNDQKGVFKFRFGPTVYIRSSTDPHSIEGITDVYSIWADEAGMFSKYFWENVEGRAALKRAPIYITTTPYYLNWLYHIVEEARKGKRDDILLLEFKSIDNPYFPREEYFRQKALLDPVRFAMKFDGVFGRIEGLVFKEIHTMASIKMPVGTRYFGGVDWGYTHPFVLVVRAYTPDGKHYRVAEFYKTGLLIDEMTDIAKSYKAIYNIEMFICDPAEPKSIASFNKEKLNAIPGNNNIMLGLSEHNKLIKQKRFFIFDDTNPFGTDEYSAYHYPEKKDLKIDQDQKEQMPVDADNHGIDADRYVTMFLEAGKAGKRLTPKNNTDNSGIPRDQLKRLEWLKRGGSSRQNRNY